MAPAVAVACNKLGTQVECSRLRKKNKKKPMIKKPMGEILGKLSEAFFNRQRAEKRAVTSGTEWSALVKQECLFQCASVAIARGNTMILRTLRQGWQQQPSASTKRGKSRRLTPKAGLRDEPPQLALHLQVTTGF